MGVGRYNVIDYVFFFPFLNFSSGKCQIMHWRHGHRDECCRQIGTTEFQDRSDFGENAMPAKQSELYGNNFGEVG